MPFTGTLSNLHAHWVVTDDHGNAQPSLHIPFRFDVVKNGQDVLTAITCASFSGDCVDDVDSVTVQEGDLIALRD